ncbi:hypothetical protein HELRODRAFT_170398 [Helobdella robusta]|uniref:Uncharacterized protein n=1 Tax=Helobdella robusta TaxID=6412 RepID=T1F303_HELRO|nr:hypothetical protein HELRODRAFT_170398 [Helobdella robusta]ESO07099.1 hypothetical protein HELRODRAFT_170398 [Helobdella robusta]
MTHNSRFNQRTSQGFDKKLIGVPVFPGSNQIFHSNNNNNVENSHATTEHHQQLPSSFHQHLLDNNPYFVSNNVNSMFSSNNNNNITTPTTATSNNSNNSIGNNNNSSGSGWKLRHVDFMPGVIRSKKDEDYEKFSALMEKANSWSIENPHALIFSCETVTWSTIDKPVYSDAGVMVKSMGSDRKTKFVRGLRLWYFVFEEVFYDKTSTQLGPFKLGYINYQFDAKADSSFTTLLNKVNADINKKAIPGKLVRLETLDMLSDVNDAETSVWYEQPEKSRDFTSFVRIFHTSRLADRLSESDDGMKACEIGVKDFIPQMDNRTPHSQGYETYSDLWKKAAKYLYANPHSKFINVQSIFVKVKKASQPDADMQSMVLWDKCTHCQHGSAYGSISNQRTEYLQILRLVFYKTNITNQNLVASEAAVEVGKKMYYKFFSPGPMKRAFISGLGSDDQDNLGTENLYEDLKQLEDKINAWINFSGAKVAGVETIVSRLGTVNKTGKQNFRKLLSSNPYSTWGDMVADLDTSKSYFASSGFSRSSKWNKPGRNLSPLVVEGEFKQIPVTWRNSIQEQIINSQTTFSGGDLSTIEFGHRNISARHFTVTPVPSGNNN